MHLTAVQWGVAIGASLAVAVIDVWQRRIPNALTLPLVTTGLLYALLSNGLGGLGQAAGACVLLAVPYVLLYVFGGGGAGDAKMMGGIGAWLGLEAGMIVLAAVALTGVVLGLVNIASKGQLRSAFARVGAAVYVTTVALCSGRKGWGLMKSGPVQNREEGAVAERLAIPYGPAIFLGVCIGAFWVHAWNG